MTAVIIWRGLEIGADADTPNVGPDSIPRHIEDTFLPAQGFPWGEVLENPDEAYDPQIQLTAYPQMDVPDLGVRNIVGAWDGVYGERGPVVPFGYEVSGGLSGDQALGRIMRFQNLGPERYDVNGVQEPSYADELAARLAANGQGQVSDAEFTTSLLQAI